MDKVDISINVCTYNRSEMLHNALRSLNCQKTDGKCFFEIIVIDNGSTDDTRRVVSDIAKDAVVPIRYVLEEVKGIPAARNRGLKESRGEWIAFFDDDQIAEPNWLKQLFERALEKGVYCVSGAVRLSLSQEELSRLSRICRRILGESIRVGTPIRCGRKTYLGTGNALVNRSIFDVVGNFDESLVRGGSDIDFFRRVRMVGFAVWHIPTAVVTHSIPRYRLTEQFFKWASLRIGDNFANNDLREWGLLKTTFACIARVGQALLVNLPRLVLAYFCGNNPEILGRQCLLWRAEAYVLRCLSFYGAERFLRNCFFHSLEYRKEKELFSNSES